LEQGLPGGTIADIVLQYDTLVNIVVFEIIAVDPCQNRRIANTEVIEAPHDLRFEGETLVYVVWAERWTVDRCGALVTYRADYESDVGGTNYVVSIEGG